MKKTKVQLMDLVVDPGIRVREVNEYVRARYSEAFKAGAVFPPIIVDGKNRIISGHHRYEVYRVNCKPDYMVECQVTELKKDADLLILGLEENAKHGNPLGAFEKRAAALRLVKDHKISPERIAEILGVRINKIEEWAGIFVHVIGPTGSTEKKPLKPKHEHMTGKTVPGKDYNSHVDRDYSVSLKILCDQIISIITRESNWVSDISSLERLNVEVEDFLSKNKKQKGA